MSFKLNDFGWLLLVFQPEQIDDRGSTFVHYIKTCAGGNTNNSDHFLLSKRHCIKTVKSTSLMSEKITYPNRYFIINKPFDMVSQFVSTDSVRLLGDLDFKFPEGTHAVGRLDNESEGLLILTTNKKVTRLLFQGEKKHKRTYLVLVKNYVSEETVNLLQSGISIRVKGGDNYVSSPCEASIVTDAKAIYPYASDLREAYPHTWLLLTLTEGKFHQVRKMVLAVNHRCLRLIRVSIENILLNDLKPGEVKEFEEEEFFRLLEIEPNA